MVHTISLDNGFSGEHMGLVFAKGEAHTDAAFLASRLRSKGYTVTADEVAVDETVSDQGEAAEAPYFVDEEIFEVAAKLAEAGEITPRDFEKMTVADLKNYAESKGIELGSAKVKADIITAINAAMFDGGVPEAE